MSICGPLGRACRLILGPPGTGKTARLLDTLRTELAGGVPPEQIAFVTFTRAARAEACDRVRAALQLAAADLRWFRTIHSVAYRLLGLRPQQVMNPSRWREFGGRFGYDLTVGRVSEDDEPNAPPMRTQDDVLRAAVLWAKNRRLPTEKALPLCPFDVPPLEAIRFADRLQAFRAEYNVLDFPDMLDAVIQKRLRPEVRVAFVDEAQDLSPLQAAVVEMWFRDCDRVYVAGDDDQAIFGFQGADPGWIMSIASRGAVVETLGRSYRLPRRIHGLAQSIIRQNRQRVDKSYEPRPEDGEVLELPADDVLDAVADAPSVLILARNKSFLQPWVARLLERTEPFTAEGRLAGVPLDTPGIVAAVTAGLRLQRGDPIPAADLNAMLQLVPAQGAVPLPRGTKARAARRQGGLARDELARSWGLGGFLGRLDAVGPAGVLVRLPTDQRLYLARLLDRFGDLPMPRIRLLTIHGAKGREADSVVVIPDMSRAAYETLTNAGREGEEAENRVAYVAVTRAKRRLILIEPSTQRFYPYGDMSLQTGVGVSR